jgi:hypothetical protein
MKKTILLLSIFLFGVSGLFAQSGNKMLQKKQVPQEKKIEQGIKKGEITKIEAKKLLKQEKKLNQLKKNAKVDGFISQKEKAKLKKESKKTNRKIYKEKHNKQKRSVK